MSSNEQVVRVLAAIMEGIEEVARAAGPMGAPSGPMYASLMAFGISLDQYNQIIAAMQNAGRIRVSNHCIHLVEGEV